MAVSFHRKLLPAWHVMLLGCALGFTAGVNGAEPAWITIGHGTYKRFFIHVYDATLEAQQPQFSFPGTTPFAITLVYKLDLDADTLIENALDEWKKQKLVWSESWVSSLMQYLPAVNEGDSLRLEVNADHSAVFLYNGKTIVTFTDPDFVNAFVGIWLSERTDNTTLRRQLLGFSK